MLSPDEIEKLVPAEEENYVHPFQLGRYQVMSFSQASRLINKKSLRNVYSYLEVN